MPRPNRTTGHKHISFTQTVKGKPYRSTLCIDYQMHHVGSFWTIAEAQEAIKAYMLKHWDREHYERYCKELASADEGASK